jgi:hypothetical protein
MLPIYFTSALVKEAVVSSPLTSDCKLRCLWTYTQWLQHHTHQNPQPSLSWEGSQDEHSLHGYSLLTHCTWPGSKMGQAKTGWQWQTTRSWSWGRWRVWPHIHYPHMQTHQYHRWCKRWQWQWQWHYCLHFSLSSSSTLPLPHSNSTLRTLQLWSYRQWTWLLLEGGLEELGGSVQAVWTATQWAECSPSLRQCSPCSCWYILCYLTIHPHILYLNTLHCIT